MNQDTQLNQERFRYRVTFCKQGSLRYTSHLDIARLWERVLRRARIPLIYSQGFNPRPKMQLAAALPLGFDSSSEIIDIWVDDEISDLHETVKLIQEMSPPGLITTSIEPVDLKLPALQAVTRAARYRVALDKKDVSALQVSVEQLLAKNEIVRERREKEYDLRPLVADITVFRDQEGSAWLEIETVLSQKLGTGRPDEVLEELGVDASSVRVTRTAILFD